MTEIAFREVQLLPLEKMIGMSCADVLNSMPISVVSLFSQLHNSSNSLKIWIRSAINSGSKLEKNTKKG